MDFLKRAAIEEVKNKILSSINPKSIVLFGSAANGNAKEDSDIDILVIWDEKKEISNIKRRIMLRQMIGFTQSPLDLLTCTTEELKLALKDERSFTSDIIRSGKVIYGRLD